MILLITFAPILAAALIMLGSPARITALIASVFTLLFTVIEYLGFKPRPGAFQDVHSLSISPDLGLSFTLGVDGLSLVLAFDDHLGTYYSFMPVLWLDHGFVDLMLAEPVTIMPLERD